MKLSDMLNFLKLNHVPAFLVRSLFRQIYALVNAELFNRYHSATFVTGAMMDAIHEKCKKEVARYDTDAFLLDTDHNLAALLQATMATHWRSSFRPLLLLLAVLLARHTCVQAADKANATQPAADDPVVKAEKEAGDIVPQGACKAEITAYCSDLPTGNRSLERCLSTQVKMVMAGKVKANPEFSAECLLEIRNFKIALYKDISMNKEMVEACKEDIASFCDDDFLYPEPGNVLACLRESKESGRVSDQCATMVFEAQEDAADDFRMDPQLNMLCSKDADTYCGDVQSGEGRIQECLRRNRKKLNWECQAELFRQEVENADDIRLNVRLFRACLDDKRRFCPDVLPGDARVKDCLEEHRSEPEFSKTCKAEFDKMMERRAVDFRLDASLRKYCHKDIVEYTLHGTHHITHSRAVDFRLDASLRKYCHKDIVEPAFFVHARFALSSQTCYPDAEDISDVANWDSKVMECLQDYKEELKDPRCRQQVHRLTKRAAEDIRFDHPLHDACQPDQEKLCKDVPSGHARVFTCLQDHRKDLRPVCRAALFDQEIRYAGDIDFKFAMRQACADEMKRLCSKAPDMVKCLQDHVADADMGKACADEVKRDEQRSAQDFRLNFRLNHACFEDVQHLCINACAPPGVEGAMAAAAAAAGQACGGAVLKCLSEKVSQLQNAECREEVFYFERRTVEDPALDVPLQQACKDDADMYCGVCPHCHFHLLTVEDPALDVPLQQACKDDADMYCGAGAGYAGRDHSRTLSCLRQNRKKLSAKCKAEELRFTAMEVGAVRRTLSCLRQNRKKLSAKCKAEELRFTAMEASDIRLTPTLMNACALELHQFCHPCALALSLALSSLSLPFPPLPPLLAHHQASDIRLTPTLMNACGLELHQFCRGVPPMGGHAFRCLQWHIQESGMSVACRAEVDLQTMRQSQYYRTDIALQLQCDADVEEKCSEVDEAAEMSMGDQEAEGDYGPILRCLLQSYQTLKPACQSEVTYVVRNALWMYHSNAPLTKPCHTDIDTLCNSTNVAGFSEHKGAVVGVFGQCLVDTPLTKISDKQCRQMVGVVAGSGGHVGGLVNENQLEDTLTKIAEIQLVAQAEAEEQAEGSPLVLTGWLAFIAITALAALLLGGGFFIYRRYFDPRRNYTVVVKAGDV
ncbi:unnamed protein product [Closterium sp. Naga37s-1]|nr:unnamed protein product [Closterium sp. Naga37s-1]